MAEQTDEEVCSICLNSFQEPVIIDCQHSFCFICLDDYVKKTSTNDQFLCPLCRCLINVGKGGIRRFTSKLNIEENSVINISRCDVCTEDTSQYFCQDCDQYLCKSCKTIHGKLKSSKDHVLCQYDENQVKQQPNEPMKGMVLATSVIHPNDFCANHEGKKVKIYCKDCLIAVCFNCFVTDHNGHNLLDLQKNAVRKGIRQDLKTLNDNLEKQITNFQKHYDNLHSKLIQVTNCIKTECDKVDAQVDNICSEFRKIGENIKMEMQNIGEHEESKFGKLMGDIRRLTEDLKASVKYSVNILEDSSIVQVLQRLPKVRQEKDESCCRKLDIPDVRYSTFQVAKIDKTLLTNQLGKFVSFPRGMIGKDASCNQNMFEDIFSADTAGDGYHHYSNQHVVSGFTWSIAVYKFMYSSLSPSLSVVLNLNDVEDKSITSCNIDVTYKLIKRRLHDTINPYNHRMQPSHPTNSSDE